MKSAPVTLIVLLAMPALAQDRRSGGVEVVAAPAGAAAEGVQVAVPSPPAPDLSTHQVAVPAPIGDPRGRDSARAGAFKALQALETTPGRARVSSPSGERTVRPGDALEGAVIKAIEPGRIVLSRPAGEGKDDLIVLTFDSAGHPRVRVYAAADPGAGAAPPVR